MERRVGTLDPGRVSGVSAGRCQSGRRPAPLRSAVARPRRPRPWVTLCGSSKLPAPLTWTQELRSSRCRRRRRAASKACERKPASSQDPATLNCRLVSAAGDALGVTWRRIDVERGGAVRTIVVLSGEAADPKGAALGPADATRSVRRQCVRPSTSDRSQPDAGRPSGRHLGTWGTRLGVAEGMQPASSARRTGLWVHRLVVRARRTARTCDQPRTGLPGIERRRALGRSESPQPSRRGADDLPRVSSRRRRRRRGRAARDSRLVDQPGWKSPRRHDAALLAELPRALDAAGNSIELSFWPPEYPDVHELQGGEQKTHEAFVLFGPDTVGGHRSNGAAAGWCVTRIRSGSQTPLRCGI
jgi:hypothetical protein